MKYSHILLTYQNKNICIKCTRLMTSSLVSPGYANDLNMFSFSKRRFYRSIIISDGAALRFPRYICINSPRSSPRCSENGHYIFRVAIKLQVKIIVFCFQRNFYGYHTSTWSDGNWEIEKLSFNVLKSK